LGRRPRARLPFEQVYYHVRQGRLFQDFLAFRLRRRAERHRVDRIVRVVNKESYAFRVNEPSGRADGSCAGRIRPARPRRLEAQMLER